MHSFWSDRLPAALMATTIRPALASGHTGAE
jgi:hypothetical protein